MIFSNAHAHKNAYFVQVAKKIPLTKWTRWVPMRVSGPEFGTLLASRHHFKEAVNSKPTAEIIQLSCRPANGSAAPGAAESLHASGIGLPAYASEQTVFTIGGHLTGTLAKQETTEVLDIGSFVEYDRAGNIKKSPWVRYPAPWESDQR